MHVLAFMFIPGIPFLPGHKRALTCFLPSPPSIPVPSPRPAYASSSLHADPDFSRVSLPTLFTTLDVDGSGCLSPGEFNLLLTRLDIPHTDREADALFRSLDEDASGGICIDEFEKWYSDAVEKVSGEDVSRFSFSIL